MELAPICVFSYDRPDHLRRTLDALSQNTYSKESVVYIFCDGAKPFYDEDGLKEGILSTSSNPHFTGTRQEYADYLYRIEENEKIARLQSWPRKLIVKKQTFNLGLADSIISGVTEVVNRHGRIIMLEDDIITSTGFLSYMNEALEIYKSDERVMHISAYMYPHRGRLPQTFFYPKPYPGGGWATWKRAWQYYDDDTEKLYNYWHSRWDEFNIGEGIHLQQQIEDNLSGKIHTWFVKWHSAVLMHQGLTLYPGNSLTTNIGFDSTATNCLTTNKFWIDSLVDSIQVKRGPLKINKRGSREIKAFYQGRWYQRRRRRAMTKKILTVLGLMK